MGPAADVAPFDGPTAMTGRFDEAESAMADALSGLAEMQLSAISVFMAFLAGWIATLAGDSAAAERSLRDALSLIRDPDDHVARNLSPTSTRSARRPQ